VEESRAASQLELRESFSGKASASFSISMMVAMREGYALSAWSVKF
jgi:hypothetical protein